MYFMISNDVVQSIAHEVQEKYTLDFRYLNLLILHETVCIDIYTGYNQRQS